MKNLEFVTKKITYLQFFKQNVNKIQLQDSLFSFEVARKNLLHGTIMYGLVGRSIFHCKIERRKTPIFSYFVV